MIAACPKCHTRYRVQPEQLGPDGARLRCSACSAVFRVRAPAAAPPEERAPARAEAAERAVRARPPEPDAEPGPSWDRERLVVVAHADAETAKRVADALESWGLETLVAHDGVEAMLAIQRALPRAVVLDAALPKMYGFQVCEIVKRNESLRTIRVVLVGAIHKEERYRRAPHDLYGADVYVEPPDLPDALLEIVTRFGLPVRGDAERAAPARADAPPEPVARAGDALARAARSEAVAPPPGPTATEASHEGVAPRAATFARPAAAPAARPAAAAAARPAPATVPPSPAPSSASPPPRPAPAAPAQPAAADDDPLAAERAKAERLARIIVSDIVLYNPEKFAAAARAGGDVAAAMREELEEGRALFRERIHPEVRAERDYLAEELLRAAKARSGQ